MDSAAKAKDYVKALELTGSLSAKVTAAANNPAVPGAGDPELLHFDDKELPANSEALYKVVIAIDKSKGSSPRPSSAADRAILTP